MKTAWNDKIKRFHDIQITVYRGSRAVEIVQGAKTVRYGPWKWQEMTKFTSFVDFQLPCTGVTGHWNRTRSQKQCATAHKNGQKWQNSRVLSTSKLSYTRGHGPLKYSPKQKKQCAIAHENGKKWQYWWIMLTSKLPCTGGHGSLKSYPEPKISVL